MADIKAVKDIVAENPSAQVWKLLRHFKDVPAVSRRIRELQGVPGNQDEANISKQARQLGYCIRQAEEYFQAASLVGLATRPNLMYYGAASLSQALVLLRQNGDYSFDRLERDRRHRHHGLDPCVPGVPWDRPIATQDFFASLACRVHVNDDQPWGHFSRFYRSLCPTAHRVEYNRHVGAQAADGGPTVAWSGPAVLPIAHLIGRQITILSVLQELPDLFAYLTDLGIEPGLCRGLIRAISTDSFAATPGGPEYSGTRRQHQYYIDAPSAERQQLFTSRYAWCQPPAHVGPDSPSRIPRSTVILYQTVTYKGEETSFTHPELVEDIGGRLYYVTDPSNHVPEPAAMLMILFTLGMLCRYHPHVWLRVLDVSVEVAELTDLVLNVIQRKFPNLILDQLTGAKHHIHV